MNAQRMIKASSQVYVGFSILSLGYVALLSVISPEATMNLVSTVLPNNDAISSIRGIYGGVGLVITVQLIYLLIKDLHRGLLFLSLFWGAYAISRVVTIFVDGPLGDFGSQWLLIESVLCLFGIGFLLISKKLVNR